MLNNVKYINVHHIAFLTLNIYNFWETLFHAFKFWLLFSMLETTNMRIMIGFVLSQTKKALGIFFQIFVFFIKCFIYNYTVQYTVGYVRVL